MSNCKNCRVTLGADQKFCTHCGTPVNNNVPSSAPSTPSSVTRGPSKAMPVMPNRALSGSLSDPRSIEKADPVQEARVRAWIEAVLDVKLAETDICTALRSGVELCMLLNKIRPDMIKKINRVSQPFLELENVGRFVLGARALGVQKNEVIQAADLCDLPNPCRVIICLTALSSYSALLAPCLPRLSDTVAKPPASSTRAMIEQAEQELSSSMQRTQRFSISTSPPSTVINPPTVVQPRPGSILITRHNPTPAEQTRPRRQKTSENLAAEVEALKLQQTEVEADIVRHRRSIAEVDRIAMGDMEREKQKALLEVEQVRAALEKAQLQSAIDAKKIEAVRIKAIEDQQRAVAEAQDALQRRLQAEHRQELERLRIDGEASVQQRRREMEMESERIESERTAKLEVAQARIEQLERESGAGRADDLERVKEEFKLQLAVEKERIRLEADQRAIEQVRLQAERAKRDVTAQVSEQCKAELGKLKAEFAASLAAKETLLRQEASQKELELREALKKELANTRAAGGALEQERELRLRFEQELQEVHAAHERNSSAFNEQHATSRTDQEDMLRRQFEEELNRMRSVLEQRVRSEETRRIDEQKTMQNTLVKESQKLADAHRKLLEVEAQYTSSNESDRARIEQSVEAIKEAVKKAESEARVRTAVEAERDRFIKKIAELEQSKFASDATLEARLRETTNELDAQRAALEGMQAEMEANAARELALMDSVRDADGRRDAELATLRRAQEKSLLEYQGEIGRLQADAQKAQHKRTSLDNRARAGEINEVEMRVRQQFEARIKGLEDQLEMDRKQIKHAKAEIAFLKKSPSAAGAGVDSSLIAQLQQTIADMEMAHNREVAAMKARQLQEMAQFNKTQLGVETKMLVERKSAPLIALLDPNNAIDRATHEKELRIISSRYEEKLFTERALRSRAESGAKKADETESTEIRLLTARFDEQLESERAAFDKQYNAEHALRLKVEANAASAVAAASKAEAAAAKALAQVASNGSESKATITKLEQQLNSEREQRASADAAAAKAAKVGRATTGTTAGAVPNNDAELRKMAAKYEEELAAEKAISAAEKKMAADAKSKYEADIRMLKEKFAQELSQEKTARTLAETSLRAAAWSGPSPSSVGVPPPPPCAPPAPPAPSSGGPPPPPPPPPPCAPGAPAPPSAGPAGGAQADLMAAIRNKHTLKKVEDRAVADAPTGDQGGGNSTAELMAAIRDRPKLKKATDRKMPAKKSESAASGLPAKGGGGGMGMMGMMNIAQIAAQKAEARKKRVAEQGRQN